MKKEEADAAQAANGKCLPKTKAKGNSATELPPEELARYACNDCAVNVVTAGEFYMLHPAIWEDHLGLGWDDNLCIGCLEARLGRKVSFADMSSFPNYDWMQPSSARLMDRLGFKRNSKGTWHRKRQSREAALHDFQCELISDQEGREAAA
jgi:hypothetical protein